MDKMTRLFILFLLLLGALVLRGIGWLHFSLTSPISLGVGLLGLVVALWIASDNGIHD